MYAGHKIQLWHPFHEGRRPTDISDSRGTGQLVPFALLARGLNSSPILPLSSSLLATLAWKGSRSQRRCHWGLKPEDDVGRSPLDDITPLHGDRHSNLWPQSSDQGSLEALGEWGLRSLGGWIGVKKSHHFSFPQCKVWARNLNCFLLAQITQQETKLWELFFLQSLRFWSQPLVFSLWCAAASMAGLLEFLCNWNKSKI